MSVKLEQWYVGADEYSDPNTKVIKLCGLIYGHPKFPQGRIFHTGRVVRLVPNKHWARTRNTDYELGDPEPEWLIWLAINGYKLNDYLHDFHY